MSVKKGEEEGKEETTEVREQAIMYIRLAFQSSFFVINRVKLFTMAHFLLYRQIACMMIVLKV